MNTITEPTRDIPVVADVDVVVVGGGTAGVAAAVGAARGGASTLLVERYGCLGGQMTAGLVVMLQGETLYDPGGEYFGGVMNEFVGKLKQLGDYWDVSGRGGMCHFDPELGKCICVLLVDEADVKVRLHSWAAQVVAADGRIEGIITESKEGRQAIRAKAFVDCSGDGDLAWFAGADYDYGTKRVTLLYKLSNIDEPRYQAYTKEHGDQFAEELKRRGLPRFPGAHMNKRMADMYLTGIHWPTGKPGFEGEYSTISVPDLTMMEQESRKILFEALCYYRENVPGFEDAVLLETSSQLGVRCSRQVLGDHLLTIEEVKEGREFDDAIARIGGWGNEFEVPYRCIYSRSRDNLWVGGRCISATHEAQGPIRVIPPCLCTGQAAGVAAAMAVQDDMPANAVPVGDLQAKLREQGIVLRA
ncbi:MAG: FAD-dependent oxidoreductase [Armatimonadota bacterium]